jgi:hypothetical protein
MTREQLEAWCALEGLGLFERRNSEGRILVWRVFRTQSPKPEYGLKWNVMLSSPRWEYAGTTRPLEWYVHIDWTELPEAAYNSLTLEMLESITKQ